jgi:hypothetical protein
MKPSKRQSEDVGEWLTMHEVEAMVRAYVDDVAQIVAYLATEPVVVDDTEPHDTIRPPEFTPEEANTFEPVVTALGPMVGAGRGTEAL